MLNFLKRSAVMLMALLLLLAVAPAQADGATKLQLTFIGMYATSDGTYDAVSLGGTFDVLQNGSKVGRITADSLGSEPIGLSVSGNVLLIPVMDTIPADIPVNPNGYTVSIVAGRTNYAPVVVYAQAGLFRVHTESQAEFSLISEEGSTIMKFSTDSKGDYALPRAIAAGQYTLRMESASLAINKWRDKIISVKPYTGPDSVTLIDAGYYYVPEVTLRPATATPIPTATPVPEATAAPVTPEPTESLPIVTDAPAMPAETATPTPRPTSTPVPTNGLLVIQCGGDEGAAASYSLKSGGKDVAAGEITTGTSARVPDLAQGNYIVTIQLPDNVMLTGLNGYPSLQRGTAQWMASISGGKTSLYQVELSLAGTITGEIADAGHVQVTLAGSEMYTLTANGTFAQQGMAPDVYTVTCVLPEGEYEGEGWSFVASAGQTLAITKVDLKGGETVELGQITMREAGSVSGVVRGDDGQGLAGVQVVLTDAEGNAAGSVLTGADGCWSIGGIDAGSYTVQYGTQAGMLIPPAVVTVSEENMYPAVTANPTEPASLRVRVFVDENNNGVLGKNEPFLPGAKISLLTEEGGVEVVAATAVAGEDGEARLFAEPGEYILRCELPLDFGFAKKGGKDLISNSSMDQSSEGVQEAVITISRNAEAEFGIGASRMSAINGTVWHDLNGDGLWQSDEPGVPGMRIEADGTRNGLHYETMTDEAGRFEIRQIRTGTYNISYHVPDGYVFTYKANGPKQQRSIMTTEADRVGRDQIVFDSGDVIGEQNVGLVSESVVEGVCFLDANNNGYFDEGEEPMAGVQVELFRQSNNKRLKTEFSDENGYYRFTGVRADTFKLKALLPKDHAFALAIPGDPEANQFTSRESKRETSLLNVQAVNGGSTNVMLGAIRFGSISGVVFFDDNFSGEWETGEKIASGIVVTLMDGEGMAIKSAKTNKNGAYSFNELAPGSYTVSVSPKAGYAFTTVGEGSIIENVGVGKGVSGTIELALGQTLAGANAGMIMPAKVSGLVFIDANDNGVRNSSERGMEGVTVTLVAEAGDLESIQVGPDGSFTFAPVLPGRYSLRYELPEDGVFAPVAQGGNQITVSGESAWFDVTINETHVVADCGGLYLGQISGSAFADSDGSGVQDGSEARLAGLTLTLTPARTDLSEMTVTTSGDGTFAFADLRPGDYTLTVICPEGTVLSLMPDVTLPLTHGVSKQTVAITVDVGSEWLDQAIGCVKPSSYSGRVWLDEDLDGRYDANERMAAGERIVMTEQRSGSVVAEMITDEQGGFTAEGLAPGLYTLSFELDDEVAGALQGDSTFREEGGRLVMEDISVAECTHGSDALLGLVRETKLAGLVWLDSDGEKKMVAGAKVNLLCGGDVIAECLTAEDGRYIFTELMPGEYVVSVELPAGYLALEPGDRRINAENISILGHVDSQNGVSGTLLVEMARDQLQLDIGSVKNGRLGDLCWLDLNANGLQDYGEGGIPGVTIELVRNGEVAASTVSDQYGYYVFEKLYPGEYTLRVTAPAEVKPTMLRDDLPMIVSVLQENGESILVPVESDGVNYAADLGFVLVKEGKFPAGYGEGVAQDWTKLQ